MSNVLKEAVLEWLEYQATEASEEDRGYSPQSLFRNIAALIDGTAKELDDQPHNTDNPEAIADHAVIFCTMLECFGDIYDHGNIKENKLKKLSENFLAVIRED